MNAKDYVGYDTAELLKQKGFNVEVDHIYDPQGLHDVVLENAWQWNHTINTLGMLPCPSLQEAMRWLRDEHNLFIGIEPRLSQTDYSYITGYIYRIKPTKSFYHHDDVLQYNSVAQCDADSWESACERAIKFCLEHLIKTENEQS